METQQIILIVLVVALVLVLVIMPIFTNKKRQKSISDLHGALKAGDRIMTIGGIIGTVLAVNQVSPVDKEIIIETGVGDNKTTLVLDIKALYQVIPTNTAPYVPATDASTVKVDEPFAEEVKAEEVKVIEEVKTEEVKATEPKPVKKTPSSKK